MIKLFSSRLLDRAARGLAPTDHSARSVCPKLANERPHEWLVFIIKELSEPPEALGKGAYPTPRRHGVNTLRHVFFTKL